MQTRYITLYMKDGKFVDRPQRTRTRRKRTAWALPISESALWKITAFVGIICFLIAVHIGMQNLDRIDEMSNDLLATKTELAQSKADNTKLEQEIAKANSTITQLENEAAERELTAASAPVVEPETKATAETEQQSITKMSLYNYTPNTSGVVTALSTFDSVPYSADLRNYVYTSAVDAGIEPAVLFALQWKESGFEFDKISATNDYGLNQINHSNFKMLAKAMGVPYSEMESLMMDPYFNTDCAIYMLKGIMANHYENYHLVLMVYNMGGGGAQKCWNSGKYSSEYSRDISNYAQNNYGLTSMTI